ncbi:MAG: SPOR domain-containing protein [Thermodesulfobacteriota bacterium]|nr:SPOR domain-containing protein [Thermodesulfobacteriota bacterium]
MILKKIIKRLLLVLLLVIMHSATSLCADFLEKGLSALESREYTQAVQSLSAGIESEPDKPDYFRYRGIAWHFLGAYDKAVLDYSKALEKNQKDGATFFNRGLSFLKLEQYHRATVDFGKTIEITPVDDRIKLRLAWILSTCSEKTVRNGSLALKLVLSVYEKKPEDADILDILAAAYAENGMYIPAAKFQKKAVTLLKTTSKRKKDAYQQRLKLYQLKLPFRYSLKLAIQAGAYKYRKHAEQKLKQFRDNHLPARLVEIQSNQKQWFLVRSGIFTSLPDTLAEKKEISEKLNITVIVRPYQEL